MEKHLPKDNTFTDLFVLHHIGLGEMCEIVFDESKVSYKFPQDLKLHYVGSIENIMGNTPFDKYQNLPIKMRQKRMHSLKVAHVICDLIPNQYINDTHQPILTIISTFQKNSIQTPHYIKLHNPFIDQINIGLRENINTELNFNQGRFTAVLHFKSSK